MSYHMDKEVNHAIIRLLDALCQWERNTGRKSTLVLIPECAEEPVLLAEDGKPIDYVNPEYVLALALKNRREQCVNKAIHNGKIR